MNIIQTPKVFFSTILLILVSVSSIFIVVDSRERDVSSDGSGCTTVTKITFSCKES